MWVEDSLRRIDELVARLNHIPSPTARDAARELLEVVLDLHGQALARMMAIFAARGDVALLDKLAQDEAVRALLLLYGLHPDDPATRIRRALKVLRPRFDAAGIGVVLIHVTGRRAAVQVSGTVDGVEELRREIEQVIADAAPDLDETVVEGLDNEDFVVPAALAG